MLGSIRAEVFDTYYCTATDVFDRFNLRKVVSYAHRTIDWNPKAYKTIILAPMAISDYLLLAPPLSMP